MKLLKSIDLSGFGEKYSGKVRDCYIVNDKRILITTDRISAFDKILDYIPNKGKVLNLLSAFWFEKTQDIVQNHMLSIPDPNVMIAKNVKPIPIEMVVRGYITGVTNTSIWGSYEKGERVIYGISLPDNLRKNQKLADPIITPTTKAEEGHDQRLTREEIIEKKLVDKDIYEQMENAAIEIFKRGTKICEEQGIILVDTKYEFGLYNGNIMLIDEVHTPDSSRFWIYDSYEKRFSASEEPENFDKEFLRIWFKEKGYTGDGVPPQMPQDFIMKVSQRYIDIYQKITNQKIILNDTEDIEDRIKNNLKNLSL